MAATEQLFVNHLDVLPPQTLSDHAEEFLRKEGKNLHPALDPSNHQTIPDKSLEEALPFKYVCYSRSSCLRNGPEMS